MSLDPSGVDRPGLAARLRGAVVGMLIGTATGGACAFGLDVAYSSFFFDYSDQYASKFLFSVFLLPGLGAGAILGAALGWRDASRQQRATSPLAGSDVESPDVLARLGWTALGMAVGGVLFGIVAFGLGVAYFNVFPRIPDEGGTGYALFLLILPAGIVVGSICGALAGWLGSAPRDCGQVRRMQRG